MLVFIVPLKSPAVTHSWELLSKLFERTIRSIFRQTSDDFRVIVVCHKKPEINFSDPRLTYIEVDFPVPDDDREAKRNDKRMKVRVGLFHSKLYNPSHTMEVNADDCISNKIVDFVARNPQSDGWLLKKGYFYHEKKGLLYFNRNDFYNWCGTSNIIRYGLFDIPEKIDYGYISQDETIIRTYYHSHRKIVRELRERGKQVKLEYLPFPGAIYMVEHGENIGYVTTNMFVHNNPISQFKKSLINYRKITSAIQEEFGIYDLSH